MAGADRRDLRLDRQGSTRMFGIIALIVLVAIVPYGIRQSTDTPLDRVDPSLWPYMHH